MRPPAGPASRSRLVAVVGGLAALQSGLFFWYEKGTIIRQPFWDMYSWVLHYLDYRANGHWWAYLWAQHDVHRPVFIRLLTALDVEAFAGVSYPFIIVTTALHLVTAWLLWRETRHGVSGAPGRALGWIVLMLVLTSTAAVDAAIPIVNGYLHVLAFTVLAILLFDGAGEGTGDRTSHWRRGAALVAAVGASFASAVGLTIWPLLIWIAWRGRVGRTWTIAVVGAALVFVGVYLYGMQTALAGGTRQAGPGTAADLLGRANYLLTFLGLPWTRSSALEIPGRILGAVLLVVVVTAVVWRGVIRPPSGRLERVAVALIMFSLAAALLASVGRTSEVSSTGVLVPVRYSVLLTPLHVGLLWLVSPLLSRWWNDDNRWMLVATGMTTVCMLLLVQQVAGGQAAVTRTRAMRATLERFVAGQTGSEMTDVVYADLDQARRELLVIRRAGLYLDAK